MLVWLSRRQACVHPCSRSSTPGCCYAPLPPALYAKGAPAVSAQLAHHLAHMFGPHTASGAAAAVEAIRAGGCGAGLAPAALQVHCQRPGPTAHRCRSLSIQKADPWQCQAVPAQQRAVGHVAADCSARSTAGHQTTAPARCRRFLLQPGDNAVTHALRCAASMLTGARHRHTLIARIDCCYGQRCPLHGRRGHGHVHAMLPSACTM